MKRWLQTSHIGLMAVVLIGLVCAAGEVALLARPRDVSTPSVLDKTTMVDRVVFTDSPDAFAAGKLSGARLIRETPAHVVLDDHSKHGYPREGTWTSPVVDADFPFVELLPSWNATTPADTGAVFQVRVKDAATQTWSPWLHIGQWGRVTDDRGVDSCDLGRIDTDTLKLHSAADAYQIRAMLQRFNLDEKAEPSLRRVTVCYSGKLTDESAWAADFPPLPSKTWVRDLKVPFRAQGRNARAITDRTCSPTSTSMVMAYWGIDRPTMENCLAIYDQRGGEFGNWANAAQRAGELGLTAWVQRFRNWDQVKAQIAQNHPIIASIRFEKGSFPSDPIMHATAGHLIVIRGFTANGDVIVNDPADHDLGDGIVYRATELAHAWFGGTAAGYVIVPPPAKAAEAAPIHTAATQPSTLPATAMR